MEKIKLTSKSGTITVMYKSTDDGSCTIQLLYAPKSFYDKINDRDRSTTSLHLDDVYENEKGLKYNVKISINARIKDLHKKSHGGISFRSKERTVKRGYGMSDVLFECKACNSKFVIKIPQRALFNYTIVKEGPTRTGYINPHHHPNCGVTQVVSGGKVSPR